MAHTIRTELDYTDDLTGKHIPLDEVHADVKFSWDGVDYTIDLSTASFEAMSEAMQPFIAAATKVRGASKPATAKTRSSGGPDPIVAEIRAWASEHGIDVPSRGRISTAIRDQFTAWKDSGAPTPAKSRKKKAAETTA